MNKKFFFKKIIIAGMTASFAVSAITGIFKYKEFFNIFPQLRGKLPFAFITAQHRNFSLLLVIFIAIHLIMQRKWFRAIYQPILKSKKSTYY